VLPALVDSVVLASFFNYKNWPSYSKVESSLIFIQYVKIGPAVKLINSLVYNLLINRS